MQFFYMPSSSILTSHTIINYINDQTDNLKSKAKNDYAFEFLNCVFEIIMF